MAGPSWNSDATALGISKIQRTQNSPTATLDHMRIDLGGSNIRVPQLLLNCADVRATFEQMGGE